jgi:tRNA isopentenyl-2-thiomethyl-A-37 hydroxylase MiaE
LCCIEEKIEKLDSRDLVLWDVDGTLIAPDDAILQLKGRSLFNRLIGEYSTDRDLFREVRLKTPHSLVDIRILDLVQKLQAKNIPSIAFTAAPAKINNLQQAGDWRVEELQRFGLDFRYSFIDRNFLEFPKNSDQSHFPLFKSGVLYSSLHPKGDVLTVFLHLMDLIPSKVILIDDELYHLQSVMASLEKMGIPSLGIHFTLANAFFCELNPEVARFQIDYFVKHDVWLNDQECQNMLKEKN